MSLLPGDQKFVDDFFAAIAPYQSAFQHIGFSYLAIKFGEPYQIVRGCIFMNTATASLQAQHFHAPHVRAGHYYLKELASDVRDFINQLTAGIVKTPTGPLHFLPAPGGRYAASFIPLHPDGLVTQRRFNVLTIMAGEAETIRQPEIDWEIKAASPPYEGLQELANEFHLGPLIQRTPHVEVVAYNVAVVDAQNSKVDGTNASIEVLLAKGLAHDRVSLGYRVYTSGAVVTRKVVEGTAMN